MGNRSSVKEFMAERAAEVNTALDVQGQDIQKGTGTNRKLLPTLHVA